MKQSNTTTGCTHPHTHTWRRESNAVVSGKQSTLGNESVKSNLNVLSNEKPLNKFHKKSFYFATYFPIWLFNIIALLLVISLLQHRPKVTPLNAEVCFSHNPLHNLKNETRKKMEKNKWKVVRMTCCLLIRLFQCNWLSHCIVKMGNHKRRWKIINETDATFHKFSEIII